MRYNFQISLSIWYMHIGLCWHFFKLFESAIFMFPLQCWIGYICCEAIFNDVSFITEIIRDKYCRIIYSGGMVVVVKYTEIEATSFFINLLQLYFSRPIHFMSALLMRIISYRIVVCAHSQQLNRIPHLFPCFVSCPIQLSSEKQRESSSCCCK